MIARRTPLTPELTEELYKSAAYLNTQMVLADKPGANAFTPDVDAAFVRLSRTLAVVEPIMRAALPTIGDKPEWILADRGSLWILELTPLLKLTVWYGIGERGVPNLTPYHANVFGARTSNRFATVEEAKAFAVRVADRHLALAATQLRAVMA